MSTVIGVIVGLAGGCASDGRAVARQQAACLGRTSAQLGGPEAVQQLRHHPDLHDLRGPGGRAVAQAYEQCTGVTFVDAYGYEP